MDLLDDLKKVINGFKKDKTIGNSVKKDDILELIEMSLIEHRNFVDIIGTQRFADLNAIRATFNGKKGKGIDAYFKFQKFLQGKAKDIEAKTYLGSVIASNKEMIKALSFLQDNIDDYIQGKQITIDSTKTTHIIIYGILAESNYLSRFSYYLFGCCTADSFGDPNGAPFRYKFVQEHAELVASIVSRSLGRYGGAKFDSLVSNIRQNGVDMYIVGDDGEDVATVLSGNAFSGMSHAMMTSGIFGLNVIFKWLGQKRISFKDKRYRRMEADAKWLQGNISRWQTKLSGMNPNDPEYIRVSKMVENYQSQLDEVERELATYYK